MARNLGFLLALTMMLFSARSAALGLGEIELDSSLNQLLSAEIELLETKGLQTSEIVVSLGSREDFERIGVERFFFLTDLRFEAVVGRNGLPVLRVSTTEPVTEPFLNFVVQVLWPNGRLLKEYTLLLDPPTYTKQTAPVVTAPARGDPGGGPAGRIQRQPTRPDSQVSFREPSRPTQATAPQDRTSADSYGVTDRDDTLWSIAERVRPSDDVSVHQTMLAIQRLNPDAFIRGNINLLKAGYRLRLPGESEIDSVGQTQAVSQVAEHNAAWKSYRRGEGAPVVDNRASDDSGSPQLGGQIDATAVSAVEPRAATTQDGELRIVAGATGDADSGVGEGGQSAQLETRLAVSEEERDRITLENEEMEYRLDLVTSQMEQTQRQLEVRDQQIAQLQAQLAAIQTQLQAAAAAPPAAAPQSATAAPAFWQSPYVVIGGAVTLISLIVIGLAMARRRQNIEDGAGLFEPEQMDEAEETYEEDDPGTQETRLAEDFREEDVEDTLEDAPEEVLQEEAVAEEAESDETVLAPQAADGDHPTGAQTGDVIGEADIYIAYGRYPQAISLLLGTLGEDPDRSEVRLKLLEVYSETRDQSGFDEHMAQLVERCDDDDLLLEARELEDGMRGSEDGAGAADAAGAAGDADAGSSVEAGNDELGSSLIAELDEPGGQAIDDGDQVDADQVDGDQVEDEGLLSLSDLQAEPEEGHGDDLGGDLGLDFEADGPTGRVDPPVDASVEAAVETALANVGDPDETDVALAEEPVDSDFDLDDLEFDRPMDDTDTDVAVESKVDTAEAESEDAFDFLDEEDAATTKLDLARAYIDMGDEDGAREILTEVLSEGSDDQQQQAGELLEKIS